MRIVVEKPTTDRDAPDLRRRKLLLPLSAAVQDSTPESNITVSQPAHLALVDAIRRCSAESTLMDTEALWVQLGTGQPGVTEPEEGALDALLADIQADETCQDIRQLVQQEHRYYYSERHMSDNYARILVFTHEQDACATLAQSVRFECETYPRPFKVGMLALSPYDFDEGKIASALRFLAQSEAYHDIHQVEASNGAAYLYSDRFMSVGKAQGLCEWIEVEQYENP